MTGDSETVTNVSLADSQGAIRTSSVNTLETGSVEKSPTSIAIKLFEYCRERNWSGWDPYDGLNSRLFQALPLQFRIPRLALTQFLKRCPINLRPLLLVPRGQNPKGVALFLSAAVKLHRLGIVESQDVVQELAEILLGLATITGEHTAWGYHFPWQTRTGLIPRWEPNIICTTFAANALLDLHDLLPDPQLVERAAGAAQFILDQLYREVDDHESCFSYTTLETTEIHNANLLGAALVTRVARVTGEKRMKEPAFRAIRYTVNRQHPAGSWDYGERDDPSQRWIDNFHTGFNLCALRVIGRYAGTDEFEPSVRLGFDFFLAHFFEPDGTPRYYHDCLYPLDIHSASQALITLIELDDLDAGSREIARKVYTWVVKNMWNPRGFFYFQKHHWGTIRIPFMRWSQAWMLLSLATYMEATEHRINQPETQNQKTETARGIPS